MRVNFTIEGPPVGKARPRVTRTVTYTPAKTARYEDLVRYTAINSFKGMFDKDERTLKQENLQKLADFFEVSVPYLKGELTYDDLTLEEKDLEDDLVRRINDVINDEIRYSELSSKEYKRAIKLALQSALEYYA